MTEPTMDQAPASDPLWNPPCGHAQMNYDCGKCIDHEIELTLSAKTKPTWIDAAAEEIAKHMLGSVMFDEFPDASKEAVGRIAAILRRHSERRDG